MASPPSSRSEPADRLQEEVGEGLDRFFQGSYVGAYEAQLVKEFDASLPEQPHWK